ncbi:MAG: glycosyltransferase [Actinomycetota bacterium]
MHPASDLTYASFVLEGLARVLGPQAIHHSTSGFPPRYGGGRALAFHLAADTAARAFLVFTDQTAINDPGEEWASVYGMVNLAPGDQARAIALGPTFGIRLSSDSLTRRHLSSTWRWAAEGRATEPRRSVRLRVAAERSRALVKHQRRRAPISAYRPRPSEPDYVFYTAWPWAKHGDVNPPRIGFIEACGRAPGLSFEGGFAPRRQGDVPEVLPYTTASRYSLPQYLARLGRSAVAFNNPAVHGCLGWKLGEFLAMGKAIVSLPLGDRVLPAPLEHGEHLHMIDGSPESFDDAIARLRSDHRYRERLEMNARRWYDDHLAPQKVAARVLAALDAV